MEQKQMNWKRMIIYAVIMAALAGITFFVLFKDSSISEIRSVIREANLWYAVLGIGCMCMFALCEAAIIRGLLKIFRRRIPWSRAWQYAFAGFYFSSITPSATGGQPMQFYYMTRDGLNGAQSTFTLLTVTAAYQMAVLVYGTLSIFLNYPYIKGLPSIIHWLIILGVLANGLAALFILAVIFWRKPVEKMVLKVLSILHRIHLVKDREKASARMEELMEEYAQGGVYLRSKPLVFLKVIVYTFLQLTFLYLSSYCACLALGLTDVPVLQFLMMQAVLSLAVSAVPLPGSVGASESSFLVLFGSLFTSGQILPVMLLARGISFYSFLVISGLVVLYLQFHRRFFAFPS